MQKSKLLITVLNTFDLIQHVHGPTHNRGHTLDLLISRGLNISSIVIKDVASVAFVNENYDEISSSTNLYHVTKTRRDET